MEKRAAAQLNHIELVSVPVGADSFAQIGSADGSSDEGSVAVVEGWRKLCAQYFPRKPTDAEVVVNLDELKLSAEPQIDHLVAQRESDNRTRTVKISLAVTDPVLIFSVLYLFTLSSEELKKKKRDLDLQRKMQAADSSSSKKK